MTARQAEARSVGRRRKGLISFKARCPVFLSKGASRRETPRKIIAEAVEEITYEKPTNGKLLFFEYSRDSVVGAIKNEHFAPFFLG